MDEQEAIESLPEALKREIHNLDFFLTEEEEKKIPTRKELRHRYDTRPGVTIDNFEDTVFSVEEFKILEKGRDAAYAKMDQLSEKYPGYRGEIPYGVWKYGFRSKNFEDVAGYHSRIRIWGCPF